MRKRIFWAELLEELAIARITQREIASLVGSSQPAVSRLAKGGTEEPPYSVGEALLNLHLSKCGPDAHEALLARSAAEPFHVTTLVGSA
jgi:transcriptional regulator with XRE-family HTH domain